MPLSTDMPAPVNAVAWRAARSRRAACGQTVPAWLFLEDVSEAIGQGEEKRVGAVMGAHVGALK